MIRPSNVAVLKGQDFILKCRLEGETWRYPELSWQGPGGQITYNNSNDWNLMVLNAQHGYRYELRTSYSYYSYYLYVFVIVYSKWIIYRADLLQIYTLILQVNKNNQNMSLFAQQIHAFVDPPTCSFVSSDSPSGLNFTCSIWYTTYYWHPRLYIKGLGTERYTGDPGLRTLSQAVKPGQQEMVYECGAVFEWSDFPDYARNSRYDKTNLPVITETCSKEVRKNNSYTISSQTTPAKLMETTTRNDVLPTTGKGSIVLSKMKKANSSLNIVVICKTICVNRL